MGTCSSPVEPLAERVAGRTFREPAFNITVKCTCGCGDAFNAGFAAGIVNGMGPQEAIQLAQACSALNATGLGSQAGVVDWEDTLAFMKSCAVRVCSVPAWRRRARPTSARNTYKA